LAGATLRWLLGGALATLVIVGPSSAQDGSPALPGVKGEDDRVLVESFDWPWSAIVKVNRHTRGFCSGVLIAPDKAATAAHCLWLSRTETWLRPEALHVVENYRRGDWTGDSAVLSYIMGPDGALPREGDNASTHLDWAVLTLETPLGESIDIAVLPDGLQPGTSIMQAGFSQDSRHVLTLHRHCTILDTFDGGRVLTHDCDAVHGDSGSPVMVVDEDGSVSLIALHSATGVVDGLAVGIAVTVESLTEALP
jgi:protease YdgD